MEEGDVRRGADNVRRCGLCRSLTMRLLLMLLLVRQLYDSAAVVRCCSCRHVVEHCASWQVLVMSWHGGGVDVGRLCAGHGNTCQLLMTELMRRVPIATATAATAPLSCYS